jgi:hypothetical protein
MIRPIFQAQNPAISGYALGWSSCTAFAGAMAASFDRQVSKLCTGGQVRQQTGDTTGGTTLAQLALALRTRWTVDLDTRYRLSWADFAAKINAGCAAILQGGYGPIADSRFDAGRGFRGNHAIAVIPGWIGMDPLADGRYGTTYAYKGEAYPQSLLKAFAGKLDVTGTGSLLGSGLVYAAFTRDRVSNVLWKFSLGPADYTVYSVSGSLITGTRIAHTGGFSASCTAPQLYSWAGHTSQSLVRLTSGSHAGQYVRASHAHEVTP